MSSQLTRYEIVAWKDGEYLLVGYTPRLSRAGLSAAMQNVGDALIERLQIDDQHTITFGTKPRPWAQVAGWQVEFTGRTQREAKQAGEHPFVGSNRKS